MSYVGNQPTSTAFLTDQFSGNGSTTTFTLSAAPAGASSILVSVSGVLQDPTTYGVVGTTLTLGGAAPSGTGNISVRYLGIPAVGVVTTAYRTVTEFTATAGQTTFTPPSYTVGYIAVYLNGSRLGASDFTATNGTTIVLATGASVDDLVVTESFYISSVANAIPAIPGAATPYINDGDITTNKLANNAVNLTTKVTGVLPIAYGGTGVSAIYAQYLVVAGGGSGGGGGGRGGGGGAGGVLSGIATLSSGTTYTVTIGGGAASAANTTGNTGSNSVFSSFTASGGGGGGGGTSNLNGTAGGSGGGAGAYNAGNGTPGSGTSGQGYSGGYGYNNPECTGGGGGAGCAGFDGSGQQPGHGGSGILSTITGYPTYYAGGGGAGGDYSNAGQRPGYGGVGGGGRGHVYNLSGTSANVQSGTANTGGGGGGSSAGSSFPSGAGGSGVVIISLPTSQYTGTVTGAPTVTTVGPNTVIKWTSSGSYTA